MVSTKPAPVRVKRPRRSEARWPSARTDSAASSKVVSAVAARKQMASKRFDLPTPLVPAMQVNGPKRTSTSTRFLKPLTFNRVSMVLSFSSTAAGPGGMVARAGSGPAGSSTVARSAPPAARGLDSRPGAAQVRGLRFVQTKSPRIAPLAKLRTAGHTLISLIHLRGRSSRSPAAEMPSSERIADGGHRGPSWWLLDNRFYEQRRSDSRKRKLLTRDRLGSSLDAECMIPRGIGADLAS